MPQAVGGGGGGGALRAGTERHLRRRRHGAGKRWRRLRRPLAPAAAAAPRALPRRHGSSAARASASCAVRGAAAQRMPGRAWRHTAAGPGAASRRWRGVAAHAPRRGPAPPTSAFSACAGSSGAAWRRARELDRVDACGGTVAGGAGPARERQPDRHVRRRRERAGRRVAGRRHARGRQRLIVRKTGTPAPATSAASRRASSQPPLGTGPPQQAERHEPVGGDRPDAAGGARRASPRPRCATGCVAARWNELRLGRAARVSAARPAGRHCMQFESETS